MRHSLTLLAIALLVAACSPAGDTTSDISTTTSTAGAIETPPIVEQSYAGTVAAPEFPDGLDWINSNQPIQLSELTGKIVLLDFWTYGCINCIHVIPDLKRLEEEYADELVVIGVHSAKFANEGETENIRQVVMRYGVDHPVVNDAEFAVWQTWGAQAWPTVALIDPAGNVVGMQAGEGVYETVQPVIEGLINEFSDQIDRTPFVLTPERDNSANTVLSYPGKVTVGDGVLYISDTGHHRVLAVDPITGEVVAVYGSGLPGFSGGTALSAEFDSPQGLAFDPATGVLYVADTNNHAIRTIATDTGEVGTLAGIGTLGWPPAAGVFVDARLNSPWGLTLHDGDLWIAMAGFHQIWVADLAGGVISPAVGSALEGVANGSLADASLAQPSALVFGERDRLYFADSESSSIRWADALATDGQTGVLSGSDVNLFDFGDVDGTGTQARLQHPLAVVWEATSGDLIIADTYNSKLKRIDPTSGDTVTYLGREQGWADGADPRFYEPGGLAIDDTKLFVADTNNHVIRVVDLETDVTSTLVLHGIEKFAPSPTEAAYAGTVIELPPVDVGAGVGTIVLDIGLPAGYKVNEQAPSSVTFSSGSIATLADGDEQSLTGTELPVYLAAEFSPGSGIVTADMTLLYCRNDSEGLCIIEQVRFSQPLTVLDEGSSEIVLPHQVQLPNF